MLPFRSGRSRTTGASLGFILAIFVACAALAEERKPGERKKKREERRKGENSLTNIPLTIGHEAKGIVLPDYDLRGNLRGRFEAGSATRLDKENIQFRGLKVVTFTKDNKPDVKIDMSESVLNLETRVITSDQRTSVARADFTIAGDKIRFDTAARKGTFTGNVKMTITNQSQLLEKKAE